jgi:hypothetical protein
MKAKTSKAKVRRGKLTKCIQAPGLLAVVEVAAVYYPSEPDEPYREPPTVKFLDEARRRAKAADRVWLKKHGAKLYIDAPAA